MMGYSHCFYTDGANPQMVCAFSLSHSALRTELLPKPKRNKFNKTIPNPKRRSQYPAILIGRLCVFDDFRHFKVGDEMMDLIKTIAIDQNNPCAARFLVVDAVNNEKVIEYYQNNGFKFLFESDSEEQGCLHNVLHETLLQKIKKIVSGTEKPAINCPTRLMYFDLIVLNQDA
ncbi:MAG: N-acetyltransferase [Bacteroidales bacterium]